MIIDEEINGIDFVEQTTYYIYRSREDRLNDERPFLITSDKKIFESYKEKIKNGEMNIKYPNKNKK